MRPYFLVRIIVFILESGGDGRFAVWCRFIEDANLIVEYLRDFRRPKLVADESLGSVQ